MDTKTAQPKNWEALALISRIEKEPEDAKTKFLVSVVGPIASAVIGFVCLLLAWALGWTMMPEPATPLMAMLVWLGYINDPRFTARDRCWSERQISQPPTFLSEIVRYWTAFYPEIADHRNVQSTLKPVLLQGSDHFSEDVPRRLTNTRKRLGTER